MRLSNKENSEIRVSGKPFLNSFFDIANKHASKNLNPHNSPCLPDIENSGIVGLYEHLNNKKVNGISQADGKVWKLNGLVCGLEGEGGITYDGTCHGVPCRP